MTIRERTQELERLTLSPGAALSERSRGRDLPLEECPIRTCYQRDRDRIIHCNAYRRLMHKTQVFLSPEGDHYRTRLTHTLEVNQIARTIGRALRLNEDLIEAIAMGHDLGHTPFGHAGESMLNQLSPAGYSHSVQSVRVVERLERGGKGLNLTWEVRDGILHHSYGGKPAATLEGQVVRLADKIAYMNHDIDDAVRAGILSEGDLPWEVKYTLGYTKSQRITAMIASVIDSSSDQAIAMSPPVEACYKQLRDFLFDQVYTNPVAKGEEVKAKAIIGELYRFFSDHPQRMPEEYQAIADQEGLDRAVCDYISGMSDRFCVAAFEEIFIPKSWGL